MKPETEADLANIVADLNQPVRIVGGGTRGIIGSEQVLSIAGLSGVSLYEPGALTLVAKAGTPVSEIEAVLAAEGQQLAFEPMDHRGLMGTDGDSTIGGVVAANVSGPRRIQAGACRDYLLGVRYVDGLGQVIKNGGRVMKNVTGYDLVKLMAGSWGTLGVLSEVSLKVLPKSESIAALAVQVGSVAQAVQTLSVALKSPFEVSGAAYDPAAGHVLLRLEGFADSVAYRVDRLKTELAGFGEISEIEDGETLWRSVRDVSMFSDVEGDVWRISVKPGAASEIAARLEAEKSLLDWGGGLIWALVPEGSDVRTRLGAFEGHASLVRADAETVQALGRFQPEAAGVAALSQGLRQRFDPNGIFNPGLMG
ncbi:FAD-binding protein [uncultured Ruegeria sp.]|uniref:FAD-binding protein n=1 Tax=uncultured Ruegeria sp. TaxID=259304 RepID=UPI002632E3BF|nr:FAD-binding protein [uncultured Ruegeria sp.]